MQKKFVENKWYDSFVQFQLKTTHFAISAFKKCTYLAVPVCNSCDMCLEILYFISCSKYTKTI